MLQTGVFGSALRAHRIGSPAAEARVRLTFSFAPVAEHSNPSGEHSSSTRAPRRHSEVASVGEPPARDTREAVLHLARLVNSHPRFQGEALAPRLLFLLTKLNSRLPAELRMSPSELQSAPQFEGDPELVGQLAVVTIGAYVRNPAIATELKRRQLAYIALERYFVWCRGMWLAVDASRTAVEEFRYDPEAMSPQDDIGEHSLGTMLHWLASLCVVVEGWEELKLSNPQVDDLLRKAGDPKVEGTLRHSLQRFRNGVFHFQLRGIDDPRFRRFWEDDVIRWAVPLERAFEKFFRDAWESQQQSLDEWLHRGLEKFDPEMAP